MVWVFSEDTTILYTFLSAPACTDMVYSKALERDYLPLFGFSVTMPLPGKVSDVMKEHIYVYAISR